MKDKIIQIVRNIASASGDSLADVADIYEENYFKKEIDELSTLIQEERKDAVEGLLNKCCNKCRDLIYSNYALQGQEKKKRSVEKLVREK